MLTCTRLYRVHCKHITSVKPLYRLYSTKPKEDFSILTELVYGRKRVYTSLQTIAKTKPATVSRGVIASPVTSSPLSWEWIQSSEGKKDAKDTKSWYEVRKKSNGLNFINSVKQNMREMYLPVGYPDTVHDCYKKVHCWLFLETFVGSAIGVLCSQAMLASLGLGTAEATGGAVAIQWVLKDGIGEVGKLFFIKRYASSFDSHPKTWKFVCEIFSSVGSFLQLCTSVVGPKLFLPLAAAGNMFELIHESIWVASHMTFTKNFSPNGNIGDIVAKDDAQMSTAHLLGMLSGVGLITVSHSPTFLFAVFAVLSPINIWTTVKMLNAADFEILNQAKLTLLGRKFIDSGAVVEYDKLKDQEVGFGEWIKPKIGGIAVKIKMGSSVEKAFGVSGEVQGAIQVLKHENYLLNYHKKTMHILLHQDAGSDDITKSILHSLKFHDLLNKSNITKESDWSNYMYSLEESLQWTHDNYSKFMGELDDKNWQSDTIYWNDTGMRLDWKGHERPKEDISE